MDWEILSRREYQGSQNPSKQIDAGQKTGAAQGIEAPIPFVFRFNAMTEEWWRCRELNPGHCGYEPHALTI
jgi:hypothetical protein